MKTTFGIKNFRVFDENGVCFSLRPLTLLTGCNSSGKSSIARSVLLLNSFLLQIKKDMDNEVPIDLKKYKIDFWTYPNNLFGTYKNLVHEGSTSQQITFEYSVYSLMLSKDVNVELVFEPDQNDKLDNAYLNSVKMSIDGEAFFVSNKNEGTKCNLFLLKDACIDFLPIEYIIHNYCGLESEFGERTISKEEYDNSKNTMLSFLEECDTQRKADIIKYVRTTREKNSIVNRCKANPKILPWTNDHDSFFMIPVIEWLNEMPKEDVGDAIEKLVENKAEALRTASERIVKDFVNSTYTTIGNYFKYFEQKYLNDCQVSLFLRKKSFPNLIDTSDLRIHQDYVFMDIFNASAEYIDLFGNRKKPLPSKEKMFEEHRNQPLSFHIIYEVIMAWNDIYEPKKNIYYSTSTTELGSVFHSHSMYNLLTTFAVDLIHETICPDWCGNMEYVRSDRASVKRIYSLQSDDDFSKLLKRYFDNKRRFIGNNDNGKWSQKSVYEADRFMNRWIEKFGVAKSLELEVVADGWGVSLRNGDNGRLLADEGYGITQLISILLQIEAAILSAKGEKVNRYLGLNALDGYDDKEFQYEVNTIVIEEPEIHLHPKFQSLLAEMFVEAWKFYNIHFIIETHSEYLIRKLQVMVADKNCNLKSEVVSLNYVNTEDGVSYNRQIKILKDGDLSDSFGSGFYDEADILAIQLFRNKPILS